MKRQIIQDYLQRAEMNEAQATALSHILEEMATRSEILRLEDRMISFEKRIDQRFDHFEERTDQRFEAFEARTDQRFEAFEARMEQRLDAFEERAGIQSGALEERIDRKLSDMQSELTWKIVGLVGLIVTVGTALNIIVG